MKHIKKYNEAVENPNLIPKYQDIIDMIDANQLKIINTTGDSVKEYIINSYQRNIPTGLDNGSTTSIRRDSMLDRPIDPYMLRRRGNGGHIQLASLDEAFCVVVENGTPSAIIREYELMNPFLFGSVVICPGHDSITCYDIETGESKTSHIR